MWSIIVNSCCNTIVVFFPQIYTGPYQCSKTPRVPEVDNYLDDLVPGCLVAVLILNSKKNPVVGKVLEIIDDSTFKIHYWKGSYNKPWQPHMVKDGNQQKPWTDVLDKRSIILCAFELDEENKLQGNSRKYLRNWHNEQTK